jgi:hypothetical protein
MDFVNSKRILALLIIGLLSSCSSDSVKVSKPINTSSEQIENEDSLIPESIVKPDGLELFIENMAVSDYLLDTTRIKQTIWSVIGEYPTTEYNSHLVIEIPFPVESYQQHFTNPKTYFFAHWNEKEKTFKNGNDYLLMTWTIDSVGVTKEKDIYRSLHDFMGNFPSYIFRSGDKVYTMCHRLTVMATETQELTEELRNYIDSNAVIHRPFGGNERR